MSVPAELVTQRPDVRQAEANLRDASAIMMTALVAAFGLLPVALATGVGTDSQRPFAPVIVWRCEGDANE